MSAQKSGVSKVMPINEKTLFSLTEIASLVKRSRPLLSVHIEKGLLNASQPYAGGKWFVTEKHLREYVAKLMPDTPLEDLISESSLRLKLTKSVGEDK